MGGDLTHAYYDIAKCLSLSLCACTSVGVNSVTDHAHTHAHTLTHDDVRCKVKSWQLPGTKPNQSCHLFFITHCKMQL